MVGLFKEVNYDCDFSSNVIEICFSYLFFCDLLPSRLSNEVLQSLDYSAGA